MKTIIKYSTILALMVFVVSCSKDDETPTEEQEKEKGYTCDDFASKTVDISQYIKVAYAMEFPTAETGFIIGTPKEVNNFGGNLYNIIQTNDGGATWKLVFENLNLENSNPSRLLDPSVNRILFIDTKTAYATIDKRVVYLDFKTKTITPISYDVNTQSPPPPEIKSLYFFAPSSFNDKYSVGLARNITEEKYYTYVIDNTSHVIMRIFEVVAPDENYNYYNEENKFEHILHLEWGMNPISVPYIFSDNSILYGPVYNRVDETQYAFVKFSLKGESKSILKIPNKGISKNKRVLATINTHNVFAIQKGDMPFYVEFKDQLAISSIYKITHKGTAIKELPPVVSTNKAPYTDYYQRVRFNDDMLHGAMYGKNNPLALAETNDGGKTWYANTCISWDRAAISEVRLPNNTDYIYAITAPNYSGGKLITPSKFFKYKFNF